MVVRAKAVPVGIAHIYATFNNTHVSITDLQGNVLCSKSAGVAGFKGSRKSTPHAGQVTADSVSKIAKDVFGMRKIQVRIKGAGPGRDAAVRALYAAKLQVVILKDVTPLPHNGCRPSKKRRV